MFYPAFVVDDWTGDGRKDVDLGDADVTGADRPKNQDDFPPPETLTLRLKLVKRLEQSDLRGSEFEVVYFRCSV